MTSNTIDHDYYLPFSPRTERSRHNVFIWCTATNRIVMSWCKGDGAQMAARMHDWINTLIHYTMLMKGIENAKVGNKGEEAATVYKVKVTRVDVISYSLKREGKPLRDSSEYVQGHYGIYNADREDTYAFSQNFSYSNIGESFPEEFSKTAVPQNLDGVVKQRDQEQCVVTGVTDQLEVLWIVPPYMHYSLEISPSEYYYKMCNIMDKEFAPRREEMMIPANCLTMTKDISMHFCNNKLAIDVENNNRIVSFLEQDDQATNLPTRVEFPDHPDSATRDMYLKHHLMWSLTARTTRSDFRTGWDQDTLESILEEVGTDIVSSIKSQSEFRRDLMRKELKERMVACGDTLPDPIPENEW